MKKDTYYFSHDCNARKDEKILTLLVEHGYEGYGIYWALIEMMFENSDTAISRNLLKGIAYDLRMDLKVLNTVITTCYNVKLFQADKEKIWSNSLRRRKAEWIESKKQKSEAGKRGMATRWGKHNSVNKNGNGVITEKKAVITDYNKGKERKGKEIIYSAPTFDQVKDYFLSKGFTEQFAKKVFEYYEANNWHDANGKKVLSWKQKMLGTWLTDENKKTPVIEIPQNSGRPLIKLN